MCSASGFARKKTDFSVADAIQYDFNEWYSFWNLRFLV